MPEWLTIIIFLAALTMGYLAGFAAGSWKADRAPTENAWQNVRFRSIDAKKECELRAISYDHEETMALIARGAMDGADIESPADDKEPL